MFRGGSQPVNRGEDDDDGDDVEEVEQLDAKMLTSGHRDSDVELSDGFDEGITASGSHLQHSLSQINISLPKPSNRRTRGKKQPNLVSGQMNLIKAALGRQQIQINNKKHLQHQIAACFDSEVASTTIESQNNHQ